MDRYDFVLDGRDKQYDEKIKFNVENEVLYVTTVDGEHNIDSEKVLNFGPGFDSTSPSIIN